MNLACTSNSIFRISGINIVYHCLRNGNSEFNQHKSLILRGFTVTQPQQPIRAWQLGIHSLIAIRPQSLIVQYQSSSSRAVFNTLFGPSQLMACENPQCLQDSITLVGG